MVNKVTFAGVSGGDHHSRSPLVTRGSTRIDNKDSEPKDQVRLLKFPEENQIFSKTHIVKSILSFFLCQK